MKANGRRRWRGIARQFRRWDGTSERGNFWRRHTDLECLPEMSACSFTPRSLVGMTQRHRRKLAHAEFAATHGCLLNPAVHVHWIDWLILDEHKYHIGQRLRPCPGCCACWGAQMTHAYGDVSECTGPRIVGKSRRAVKAMRKWQATLADDCNGSGTLPARVRK